MPTYCYVHPKTKRIIEKVLPMGKARDSMTIKGVRCKRCLPAEMAGQGGLSPTTWPMRSNALAVHPSQRRQYMEFAAKNGVPTHFDERGKPVLRSKNHRKQYAELVGATDFDGGFGDPHCD